MRADEEEAHRFGREALQDLLDREEVAERLRHLLVVDAHERVMHPVTDERQPGGALGLRDLVLVMRENEVLAAAMEIERLAEVLDAHRRALEVPAGASRPPRAFPERLARLRRFPEREVEGVALALVDLDARAGLQLVELALRELAVAGKRADGEIDVAVRRIGEPFRDQLADHRDHLRQMLRRARLDVGGDAAERRDVAMKGPDVALGERLRRDPLLVRALDDLVLDVGDVADEAHPLSREAQVANEHVEHHHRARMADVAAVVDRHAADVESHLAGAKRRQRLDLPGQRVVQLQRHQRSTRPVTLRLAAASR